MAERTFLDRRPLLRERQLHSSLPRGRGIGVRAASLPKGVGSNRSVRARARAAEPGPMFRAEHWHALRRQGHDVAEGGNDPHPPGCVPILRASFFRRLARRIPLELQAFHTKNVPACHFARNARSSRPAPFAAGRPDARECPATSLTSACRLPAPCYAAGRIDDIHAAEIAFRASATARAVAVEDVRFQPDAFLRRADVREHATRAQSRPPWAVRKACIVSFSTSRSH